MSTKPSTRIYAIIAREAPVAVVFRRGPSKLVQLLRWDLTNDTFERGQWLKGRIYERRSDLSPSGKYLVYSAADEKPPDYRWTAISKPPYLTALAYWPGGGDACGGLFDSETSVRIDNITTDRKMTKGRKHLKDLTVSRLLYPESCEQDDFLLHERLKRDGWTEMQSGIAHRSGPSVDEMMKAAKELKNLINEEGMLFDRNKLPELFKSKREKVDEMRAVYDPPEIFHKSTERYCLEMKTLGLGQTEGPSHVTEYSVLTLGGSIMVALGQLDWADWDANGDLLYAKSGCILRWPAALIGHGETEQLIDLSQEKFEPLAAPEGYATEEI